MGKLYCLHNVISDEKYIGFTSKSIEARIKEHFNDSRYYNGTYRKLLLNIAKYGEESFTWYEVYNGEDALSKEDEYISIVGATLNVAKGGGFFPILKGNNNPFFGKTHSLESRKRMSETHKKNIKLGIEVSSKNTGKRWKLGDQTKQKMSISAKNRWKRDITHSVETRNKISQTKKRQHKEKRENENMLCGS